MPIPETQAYFDISIDWQTSDIESSVVINDIDKANAFNQYFY